VRGRPEKTADAVAPAVVLDWDTTFWGINIARVNGNTMTATVAGRLDEWARAAGVECLFFLGRTDDPATPPAAEAAGFRLVDVRVELARRTADAGSARTIRLFEARDLDDLARIARSSHELTRFYADPHFPRKRCAEFYELWIRRSTEGWADATTLVAEEQGRAVGYVSCHDESPARIGLIGVDGRARRQGHGRNLVLGAVGWAQRQDRDEMTVVTQGRNVAAQRLFEECGFRARSVDVWFHKWYTR
jgi:ribosomal protein S18 acetylase RimI-like enzyme